MRTWQMEEGHLVCRWSELGEHTPYSSEWMQENSNAQGGYLEPVPDFANHSPFGGASWFDRYRG